MKIKPVKHAKNPEYPMLDYYIKNPGLLSRNIPESWIRNKYVATSLASFIFFGCPKEKDKTEQNNTEIQTKFTSDANDRTQNDIKDVVRIAPIFAHGEGAGATGCMVMSPPVFISEDEARSIIFDALEAEGIKMDTIDCPEIKFTSFPIANDCYVDNEKAKKVPDAEVELVMDGYNKELNFAVQFVSKDDFLKFKSDDGCMSTVQGYDIKKAAEIIMEELIENGKTNTVVFYDPISGIEFKRNEDWKIRQEVAKEKSAVLLLAQVADFINWMKNENIIKE